MQAVAMLNAIPTVELIYRELEDDFNFQSIFCYSNAQGNVLLNVLCT